MPTSLVMLLLLLAAPAMGQSPATESGSVLEKPKTEPAPQSLPPSAPRSGKLPERFVPTDKISPDSVISFPADI